MEETPSHQRWGGRARPPPEDGEVGEAAGSPLHVLLTDVCQHPCPTEPLRAPIPPLVQESTQRAPRSFWDLTGEGSKPRKPPRQRVFSRVQLQDGGKNQHMQLRQGLAGTRTAQGLCTSRRWAGGRRGWVLPPQPQRLAPRDVARTNTHHQNVAEASGSEQGADEDADVSMWHSASQDSPPGERPAAGDAPTARGLQPGS